VGLDSVAKREDRGRKADIDPGGIISGIMKLILGEEQVKDVFRSYDQQMDVLLGLYRLALPNWDQIEYILSGRPRIGEAGWHAICSLFQEFDHRHHAKEDIFPGGLWLTNGFEPDPGLGDWEVDTSSLELALKK
jgi:hypothetical protein